MVGQTVKTPFVNAFVVYRMKERPDLIEDPCSFQTVHAYRQNLNNVESPSDFCFEACRELPRFADTLRKSENHGGTSPEVVLNDIDINRLRKLAKKGNGICWYFSTVQKEFDYA